MERFFGSNDYSIIPDLFEDILGAGSSIDILISKDSVIEHAMVGDILAVADSRLNKKLITSGFHGDEFEIGASKNWESRKLRIHTGHDLIIIDDSLAIVANMATAELLNTGMTFPIYKTDNPDQINWYRTYFNQLWKRTNQIVYGNLTTPDHELDINDSILDINDRIIAALAEDPENIRLLDPARFEELIEYLLKRDGFETTLTPRSKDGGKDILAKFRTPSGIDFLTYVECKHYDHANPVGVGHVRSLYGVISDENVNLGMLVTSSRFSSPALDFQKRNANRLTLKDFDALKKWLRIPYGQ